MARANMDQHDQPASDRHEEASADAAAEARRREAFDFMESAYERAVKSDKSYTSILKTFRSNGPNGFEAVGIAATTTALAERDRLKKLLDGRDKFIIAAGLWDDFVVQLPDIYPSPQPADGGSS